MKKSLLFASALALFATTVSAQSFKAQQFEGRLEQRTALAVTPLTKKVAPRKATLAANQRLAGLYKTDTYATSEQGLGLPTVPGTLRAASFWPISVLQPYEGKSLTQIRFALANSCAVSKVFIAGVTSQGAVSELATGSVSAATSPTGWSTVTLSTPWTVTTSGYQAFLVGFYYTQGSDNTAVSSFPLSMVSEGDAQNVYVYGNLGSGTGWYNLGSDYGNLSVQGIVEGEFPAEDLSVNSLTLDKTYLKAGEENSYTAVIANSGSKNAAYQMTVKLDDNVIATIDKTDSLLPSKTDSITKTFTIPANATTGKHKLTASITTINGTTPTENTFDDNASANMGVYKDTKDRQMNLIEHFTSNECTYCYLGEELLEKMYAGKKNYAWVSYHGIQQGKVPDPTNNAQADSIMAYEKCKSFPSAGFDRSMIEDYNDKTSFVGGLGYNEQYHSQLAAFFNEYIDELNTAYPSFVTLSITPNYDAATRVLNVTVSGEGATDASKLLADNNLYVYVLEDSLAFDQYTKGHWIQNENHDHVFRSALTGINGKAITWNGDNFSQTYTYTVPASYKPEHMKVTAFVAPALTTTAPSEARVNQAYEVTFGGASTGISGVTATSANAYVVARYNAAGQLVNGEQKGLNIVKMSDGKVIKYIK